MIKRVLKQIVVAFVFILAVGDQVGAQVPAYCLCKPNGSGFEHISYVQIGRNVFESANTLYSITGESTPLVLYKTGEYELLLVNQTFYTGDKMGCWIDWDQDGSFDSETEKIPLVTTEPTAANGYALSRGSVIVPNIALSGITRMRVVLSNGELSPCGSFEYGEVEDYVIDIKPIDQVPVANFTTTTTDIFLGYPIRLTDCSTYYPATWKWSFEPNDVEFLNGTSAASQDPYVAFKTAGVYSITLEASNGVGTGTKTVQSAVTAHPFKAPLNISATTKHNYVDLSWSTPLNEGFEGFEDFTTNLEPWIQIDNDKMPTVSISGTSYTNLGYTGSFIVFNPSQTTPALPFFTPHTGNKMAISFAANGLPNDDWLISPKVYVANGDALVFFARGISSSYAEKFKVAVSTTGTKPEDFEVIATESLSATAWTPFVYNFDKYVGKQVYIAIHYFSTATFGLAIDDIMLLDAKLLLDNSKQGRSFSFPTQQKQLTVPDAQRLSVQDFAIAPKHLAAFEVYRDNKLIAQLTNAWQTAFRDENVPQGEHEYYLKASYITPSSISLKSDAVKVNIVNVDPYLVLSCNGKGWVNGEKYRHLGIIPIGETYKLPIVIENRSDAADLNVSNVVLQGASLALDQDIPAVLKPHQSVTVNIIFTPSATDEVNGSLTFATNDTDSPSFLFPFVFNSRADWTYMLYLYEDGTGLNGLKDFNEWEAIGSIPEKVNLIVLYNANSDSQDGIYYLTKDERGFNYSIVSQKVHTLGVDPNMNDWHTLNSFMLWCEKNYPAKNYGLNVWDHGSGIFKSSSKPAISKGCVGDMKLWEIDKALMAFKKQAGKNLNVLGFDVCLLGQVETVYQIKDYVDYAVACEKTAPGDGWDYLNTFQAMAADPLISPEDFVKHAVKTYKWSYETGVQAQGDDGTTISATDCIYFRQNFDDAINAFANTLIEYLPSTLERIKAAAKGSWVSMDNVDHKDFGNFLQNLKNDQLLNGNVKLAANKMYEVYAKSVIANGCTGSINSNATGLRIWLSSSARSTVEWWKYTNSQKYLTIGLTRWDDFLAAFEDALKPVAPYPLPPQNLSGSRSKAVNTLTWEQPAAGSVNTGLDEGFENPTGLKWTLAQSKTLTSGDFSTVGDVRWSVVSVASFQDTPDPEQYIHGGSYSLYIPYKAPEFNWVITPEVLVKEGSALRFWTWYKNNATSANSNVVYYTKFYVVVIDDGKYIPVLSWNAQDTPSNLYQEEVVVSLSEYANKLIKVGFVYEYSDGFQMAIDDVKITQSGGKSKAKSNVLSQNSHRYSKMPVSNINLGGMGYSKADDQTFISLENLKGFRIYRNNEFISQIDNPKQYSFDDPNSPEGYNTYHVSALYYGLNEESAPSNKVVISSYPESVDIKEAVVWSVWPNPSSGRFSVDGDVAIQSLSLFAMDGSYIHSFNPSSRNIDLSSYLAGVYILKILGVDGKTSTVKLILYK